jgi:L-cysteine/cystine lyase
VLLGEVGPKTRLLALSDVCWMSGNRFPVAELKEATGLPVLVDGAQSAGAIPVDASAFDFYALSCQKWLCGPDTTGALYVADPEALAVAAPSYLSQERYEPWGEFEPRAGAARFDPGWTAPPALAGLSAALDLAPEGRFPRAAETAERCRDLLSARFDVVTAPRQATLVSFRVEGDSADVVARLYEQGVIVRDVPGQGWIRVSCGWWTSDEDLTRLMQALR